ncbi:TPA: hypothetical protein NJ378_003695 [Vibrio parahaemolyticus]|nr:hypothetical protein [Vibrio parahaemolyticus]
MSKDKQATLGHRDFPPIFTSGFRIGLGEDVAVVDFIDAPSEDYRKVAFSVALTKKQAQRLIIQLQEFVEEE